MSTVSPPWYQGFYNYWVKECGSLNYLLPTIIATLVSILVMIKGVSEPLPFTVCFASVTAFSTVAWQSIRMQATEWHTLVPGIRAHIARQGHIIIALPHVALLVSAAIYQQWLVFNMLSVTVLAGTIFYLTCRVKSNAFGLSAYLFFGTISIAIFAASLPNWIAICCALATLIVICLRKRFGEAYKFTPQALIDYKHALQSGWSPIPKGFMKGYGNQLNQVFFPLSFFVGRAMIQYAVVVFALLITLVVLNFFFHIGKPSLFLASNLLTVLAFVILWTRLQRHQSWQTLLTLPLYNSVKVAKKAYAKSAEKLSVWIFVLGLISALMIASTDPEIGYTKAVAFSLANAGGILVCFCIANFCKKSGFFSVALVFTLGAVLGFTGTIVETQDLSYVSIIVASAYCVIAIVANRYSSKFLFNDV